MYDIFQQKKYHMYNNICISSGRGNICREASKINGESMMKKATAADVSSNINMAHRKHGVEKWRKMK